MKTVIRRALLSDIEMIDYIANSNDINNTNFNKYKKNGFLVSDYNIDDYKMFVENNEHFYVLEDLNVVRAFVLIFTEEELDYNTMVNAKVKDFAKHHFSVIKQICVDRNYQKKNFGTKLYEYFFSFTEDDVFAAVVLDPINTASMGFHNKMGFVDIFAIIPEDQVKRGIFIRQNEQYNEDYDKEIIIEQYKEALHLYKHEDNLNWTKINHFFYVNGSLFVLTSLWGSLNLKITFALYLCLISLIGMISSYMFYVAINSGIYYLQERKKSVVKLEQILVSMRGIPVVSIGFDMGRKNLKRSPTTKIMIGIPRGVFFVWMFILLISAIFFVDIIKYVV